jgi:adenosylcobinamide-GDP ribazoletransferase
MRRYLIALQFLTILPVPSPKQCESDDLGRSTAWFPLVGLTIGGLLLLADLALAPLFPRHLTDALLIALLALITGALHLDGLADVYDGLAARGNKERFLAVMKDSRVGAVGVVGLVLLLLLKYAALLAVPIYLKHTTLLLFPLLSRFTQVLVMTNARAARSEGLGACFLSGITPAQRSLAAASTIPLAWLFGHSAGILALCLTALWGFASKHYFTRRLGGINGDIVGFSSEIAELLALLTLTATTTSLTRYL